MTSGFLLATGYTETNYIPFGRCYLLPAVYEAEIMIYSVVKQVGLKVPLFYQ